MTTTLQQNPQVGVVNEPVRIGCCSCFGGARVQAAPGGADVPPEKGMLPYHTVIASGRTYSRAYAWLANNPNAARALAVPAAVAIAVTAPFLVAANIIEGIAFILINLIGACFKAQGCSLRNAGESAYHAVIYGVFGIFEELHAVASLFGLAIAPQRYAGAASLGQRMMANTFQDCIDTNRGALTRLCNRS